jgi:hypothetical protein
MHTCHYHTSYKPLAARTYPPVSISRLGMSYPVCVIRFYTIDTLLQTPCSSGIFGLDPKYPRSPRLGHALAAVSCSRCSSNTKVRLPLVFECSIREKNPQPNSCKTRLRMRSIVCVIYTSLKLGVSEDVWMVYLFMY